ncbi:hypothetical protein [Bacillus marasmi]|uniref:hypothetical protein n=1 Tax=Bacillus marasmi TaxID=1926279 RepID=UPI0011C7254C|nr:hypothetical protein [Bacillus marasmi]
MFALIFGSVRGDDIWAIVTVASIFGFGWARYLSYRYRYFDFSLGMGTIFELSLPLLRFLAGHGHDNLVIVTVASIFRSAWARYLSYRYRCFDFWLGMGTIIWLSLLLLRFFARHGHDNLVIVTATSIFDPARAPFALYGYLSCLFYRRTGTIRALWLPLHPFLSQHGHHSRSMVTSPSFFITARAPFALYGYRSILFYHSTGTIHAL